MREQEQWGYEIHFAFPYLAVSRQDLPPLILHAPRMRVEKVTAVAHANQQVALNPEQK